MTPQELHMAIARERVLPYSFDETKNFNCQKEKVYDKLLELLGMPEKMVDPKPIIEFEKMEHEEFDEIRFKYESEPGFFIPAHLILPKERKGKLPTVICLQGHSSGMHRSLGRVKYTNDVEGDVGDRAFALQAVKRGYACVIMEQRGFGELKGIEQDGGTNCLHMSMQAILLGRTLLGERCFDVSRLIDALEQFEMLDLNRLGIMGNSGGGTTSFYAACVDSRIKVCMPSCSFCPYYESIISIQHCTCNYVPGMLEYMEMQDLAVLIAPRALIVVSGKDDEIFPLDGVKRGFEVVKKIYRACGAEDNCQLVIGDGGHRFFADISWPVFDRYI
ncbi:MAG: acetylxylan esterase [Clostridiaceae bacterium]|nr:acetylxylan esterase [Clostridiaceae bacterium]